MNVDNLAINTIRVLSAEAVQKANSGHPGLPLGCATMAYTLWAKQMKHNPKNSKWEDRDRFVLSAGHGSMLLYSLLNVFGYDLSVEDIKNFRQFGSKTPGHPEYKHTDGVETTTGPLGQGICNAVGMAISESYLAEKFNKQNFKVIDHYTYTIAGDGCLMEGISSEASSLAGTLGLGKLIMMYDSNNISIEGSTDIAFREDVAKRYEAYGWQVIKVADGNNIEEINTAIIAAKKEDKKPTIIIVKNIIGYGCLAKQGKACAHGEPLGVENIIALKENIGWNYEPFTVPEEVKKQMESFNKKAASKEVTWNKLFEDYKIAYPELAKEWKLWFSGKIATDLLEDESFWSFDKPMATRQASGVLINRLAKLVPNIIGGSADLAPSNKTYMKDRGDFSAEDRSGANMHFGVREHAMAAIANGIYLHGGLKVFVSTFFVFSDYMKGAMRLSAIMKLPITYVLTHDSIGVGEDGPTHEPIEQLAALRAMPNMVVFRPADSKETAAGWYLAIAKSEGPVSLVLTRQTLPLYNGSSKEALNGGYILKDSVKETPDVILIASGSEVELIFKASDELKKKGIDARVVSMPSFELFDRQSKEYKEKILPSNVRARVAVEAASSFGWHKYVGLDGAVISIDHFGASGKAEILFEEFGFTVNNVVDTVLRLKNK
ncbi:transketolase [Clostridium estertheticum]|uniref:Transketolase n=1 Tax=Clostridium estertheticum subsp. estertheticum TaxID=1552 RepID=A0A1J0GFL1_9CLOT|nr:transketolase [Clostridium estertheticum]APC40162.1 transketolase [Clostridium estertheticum subsp. estertheticum]MBZ9618051.1 transketolase [Clostridium estertheticum subsp. laramiense]WAG73708.1 transketolase [Clostridium estertheticum]